MVAPRRRLRESPFSEPSDAVFYVLLLREPPSVFSLTEFDKSVIAAPASVETLCSRSPGSPFSRAPLSLQHLRPSCSWLLSEMLLSERLAVVLNMLLLNVLFGRLSIVATSGRSSARRSRTTPGSPLLRTLIQEISKAALVTLSLRVLPSRAQHALAQCALRQALDRGDLRYGALDACHQVLYHRAQHVRARGALRDVRDHHSRHLSSLGTLFGTALEDHARLASAQDLLPGDLEARARHALA